MNTLKMAFEQILYLNYSAYMETKYNVNLFGCMKSAFHEENITIVMVTLIMWE